MRDSPRMERARQELVDAASELEKTQRGIRDLAEERRRLDTDHARRLLPIQAAGLALQRQAREQALRRDLLNQEVQQIRTKESLLELTYRRYTASKDERALRDAIDMARELGIARGQFSRYL